MSTRGWRDGYKAPKGRIDARPQNDPAVQAGLRNIHRDTRGNVIGAMTPEGGKIGVSRSNRVESGGGWRGGSATPRLDAGPQTPGLDAQAAPAPSNLQQRQALFADMQMSGAGGLTPEMSQRAQKLGIDQAGWRRGVSKLTAAPASVAAPVAAPVPVAATPAMKSMSLTRTPYPAAPAVAPASRMVEQATALRDVGRMMAARKPVEMAGPPVSSKQPPSFAVAPVANPQSIATPAAAVARPAVVAPVSAVAMAPVQPSVKPVGGPSFTTTESRSQSREKELAAQQKLKRSSYNKAWNSKSDLPGVDRNSVANKVQKSVRTFLGGNSY